MKKSKAQISGETLMYVLAIFIISLIIVLGYKYITSIEKTQESSSFIIFRNSLRNDIVSIKQDFGTFKTKEYNLPEDVDEICFSDKSKNNPLLCRGCPKSTDYRVIADSISSNSTNNIFLFGDAAIKSSFKVDYVKIGCCAFKCYKTRNGKLKLMMQGDGKYALISQK